MSLALHPDAAIVLCGGRSERMGRDKAWLPFGDETMLARVVHVVRGVVPEVVLVAREGQELPPALDLPVVRDPAEGLGPLAGIAAGLGAVRAARAAVVACDVPFLRQELVRRLLDLAGAHGACVPVVDGFPVPTCAVYRREHGALARVLVAERRLHPRELLERLDTRYVEADELREADPDLASFIDCNTPERYASALRDAGLEVPPWVHQ